MNNKKLYIRAIISGTLLLIGCFCFMLGMNKLNALSDNARVSTDIIVLMITGTIFSMAGRISLLLLMIRLLKEKRII